MSENTGFRTVKAPSSVELVINKSRFIGQCFPISSEEEALEKLAELRKKYWDATHNCYAYSVGQKGRLPASPTTGSRAARRACP